MKRVSRWVLPVAVVGVIVWLGLVAPSLWAQDEEESEPKLVLRVYDVSAWLNAPRDHDRSTLPALGAAGESSVGDGASGGMFDDGGDDDDEESPTIEILRSLIERCVRPADPWESLGGRSSIDFCSATNKMIVTTSEVAHKTLASLLAQIAPKPPVSVVVNIKVVALKEQYVRDVVDEGQRVARSDEQKKSLKDATEKVFAEHSYSGLDGQQLANGVCVECDYVAGAEPVVAENATAYDLTIGTAKIGLASCVRTTLQEDATVRLDFDLRYACPLDDKDAKLLIDADVDDSPLQLPVIVRDQRAGTVMLPLGCPTVIGGGSPQTVLDTPTRFHYIVTVQRLESDQKKP